ncbi:Uncharacterized protein PECH_007785 [Penicillium ucsense]|uniref:Uncharacterized protein n=1 Tax=Penicillium ucsense TaxID=2839758 RepID=A0A8J8WNA5_9EURO|nr:Uncharacterized protein PECM_004617 [Penicillium ucsense]KAF7734686.1 Uncharacterized protein PECH_007785 [Penicillium ucsense]
MGLTWSQFFPPAPSLTEANLPSQKGRVFMITGGYSGVGFELSKILYGAGGKIYIAGRSEAKAKTAIQAIESAYPNSGGEIVFLPLQLDDLTTIKPAVEQFTRTESRLDVLFNNAGVSNPPPEEVSPQGHELQFATNCLGPHLLTQLLLPTLQRTARGAPAASVRVIWLGSIVVDMSAPSNGINLDEIIQRDSRMNRNYTNSKTGNWFLADHLARQAGSSGVLSLVVNPGNLKSELTRHFPSWAPILLSPLLYPPIYGAYSELWAGTSPDLTMEDGGRPIIPWGRLHPKPREDLLKAMKPKEAGGTGDAELFLRYCDDSIEQYK